LVRRTSPGGVTAAEHLLSLGHRRIGHAGGPHWAKQRERDPGGTMPNDPWSLRWLFHSTQPAVVY
jgi:hypothetical protein